jgi:hypothetical protein
MVKWRPRWGGKRRAPDGTPAAEGYALASEHVCGIQVTNAKTCHAVQKCRFTAATMAAQ